jgi:uncharacterized protein (TIGR02246 family)
MSAGTSAKSSVEPAIRSLFSNFAAAWDKHDARALASLFVEDGDLINPAGRTANSRPKIEKLFQAEHSSMFKNSRMNMTISQIRTLTSDIAVVTDNCEVSGANDPSTNATCTIKAIATFVVQNDGGTWCIVSARPMIPVAPPK